MLTAIYLVAVLFVLVLVLLSVTAGSFKNLKENLYTSESYSLCVLIGGALAFICFFLPWSIDPFMNEVYTGAYFTGQYEGMYLVPFISSMVILGTIFYFLKQGRADKSKYIVIIVASVGIIELLIDYYHVDSNPANILNIFRSRHFLGTFGARFTIVGFVLALYGAIRLKRIKTKTADGKRIIYKKVKQKTKNQNVG